jgi:hypothetical protein
VVLPIPDPSHKILCATPSQHVPTKLRTKRLDTLDVRPPQLVQLEIVDGSADAIISVDEMSFSNSRTRLFLPDVERIRHETSHYVEMHMQLQAHLRAWLNIEAAAVKHIQAAREQLCADIETAWSFTPSGPAMVARTSLIRIEQTSSFGVWIQKNFSNHASQARNQILHTKLLQMLHANGGHKKDNTVKVLNERLAKKGQKGKLRKPVSMANFLKKAPKMCHASFSDSLQLVASPFTVEHRADDLIFIRDPHNELREEPQEPGRFSISEFVQSNDPAGRCRSYEGGVSSYNTGVQAWYVEKLRYDSHKEWLIIHNNIADSAQIVRSLDERINLAAWARRMVRSSSAETGNWSAHTIKIPTEPLLMRIPVTLGYYDIASGREVKPKHFPPPPPTWDEGEVISAQKRAKAEAEHQEAIRNAEQSKADHCGREAAKHTAAADAAAGRARQAGEDQEAYHKHKATEHSERSKATELNKQAKAHQAAADAAARERDRQYAIERCLPLVRKAQLWANKIREELRAHIQDTIRFFAPRLISYEAKTQPWRRLAQGELALPKIKPITLRSHEGFDREIAKMTVAVRKAQVTLARFTVDVKAKMAQALRGVELLASGESKMLISRLIQLKFFDDQVADLTAWLRSSDYLACMKEFPPAPFDHHSLRALALGLSSGEMMQSARDAWERLTGYNNEMKRVLLNVIKMGLVPFSTIINESGEECSWFQEVHPGLRWRAIDGTEEKTDAEMLEEAEAEDDEDNEFGGDESTVVETIYKLHYPAQIGEIAALEYARNFLAPRSLKVELAPETFPKWIFVTGHKFRLWYCERAEWFHPMFISKQYEAQASTMEMWDKCMLCALKLGALGVGGPFCCSHPVHHLDDGRWRIDPEDDLSRNEDAGRGHQGPFRRAQGWMCATAAREICYCVMRCLCVPFELGSGQRSIASRVCRSHMQHL